MRMMIAGVCFLFIGFVMLCIFLSSLAEAKERKKKEAEKGPLLNLADAIAKVKEAFERGDNIGEYVEVRGKPVCARPLISPVNHTKCLHYEYTMKRIVKEWIVERHIIAKTDRHWKRKYSIDKECSETVPFFMISDGTASIRVDSSHAIMNNLVDFRKYDRHEPVLDLMDFKNKKRLSGSEHLAGYEHLEHFFPMDKEVVVTGYVCCKDDDFCISGCNGESVVVWDALDFRDECKDMGIMTAIFLGIGTILFLIGYLG